MKLILGCFLFIFSLSGFAQVGIGTTSPAASSMLDVSAEDKGVLIPRVALTSSNAAAPITGAMTAGLLVYNTATVTGSNGVQPGFYYWTGSAWSAITGSVGWFLTGNTVQATDFLGTNNDQDLRIKLGTGSTPQFKFTRSGQIEFEAGIELGLSSEAGRVSSIAVGRLSKTDGEETTAIGFTSFAKGRGALALGSKNFAITTAGSSGPATDGIAAIAIGSESVNFGNGALANRDGAIAIGSGAAAQGTSSVSIGTASNTNGASSIAIGNSAKVNGTSTNSIAIGNGSLISSNVVNSMALGNGAQVNANNTIRLGNSALEFVRTSGSIVTSGSVTASNIAAPSDGRFKYEVAENVPGIEFIKLLKPVTYKFDREKLSIFQKEHQIAQNSGLPETGFIAQQVEEAANALNYKFNGINRPDNLETDNYTLSYSLFVVPLVKAIQEQQEQIEALQKEVEELKQLRAEFTALKEVLTGARVTGLGTASEHDD